VGLNCYNCPNPQFSGLNSQNYQLVATNSSGCSATVDISITVNPDYNLFIPNAFSPNNDGHNDTWQVLGNVEAVKYISILIFNRIGEKVYESNDVLGTWDGRYKGQLVPPGVYTYVVTIVWLNDFTEHVKTGSITLLR
jgi:gliding motility-associated-like protein